MIKQDTIVILGTAHRMREPGKESPDKRLKECIYSREICKEVAEKLRSYGCKVEIDYEPWTCQEVCSHLLSSWRETMNWQ
jgi:hypothetical protein